MYTKTLISFCTVSMLSLGCAFAEEGWQGSVELSAASASGNSETTNFGFGVKASKQMGDFVNSIELMSNFAESEGTQTQNNWLAAYQFDVKLRDRTNLYGRVQYEEDQFSGFDNRLFIGGGIGHTLIDEDNKHWKLQGGPGYRLSKIERPSPLPANFEDETSEFALYGASDFHYQIRDGITFDHGLNATYTESNSTITSVLGLTSQLTESFSSKVSYQVDYETDPPIGREDTDTLLKASLLFTY